MTPMAVPVISIFEVGDYDQQIGRAVSLLRDGGVVVLPTETVYGAAGLLSNDRSIQRMQAIRQRPREGNRLRHRPQRRVRPADYRAAFADDDPLHLQRKHLPLADG